MADIIQLLPDSIANQIAAGEVIQRPASVVKELMENAIDAGASAIKLIIKDSGKTLIQIIDNGSGMNETDARMSFERHATSKIKKAEDLFVISTKGFRGEALASISAIAQVELKTKTEDAELGTRILIEGSTIKKQEVVNTPTGTNFAVKNLFYNVPARRKFLKSDPVELKHINEEFIRIVLAHPNIFFTFFHNGNEIYHLPKANLRQRIVGVFGKSVNEKILPVEEKGEIIHIKGFVGNPEMAKRNSSNQYLFVNDRFIKSNYFSHAVKIAFDQLIQKDQYPSFFIFMEIDPSRIDINVHPTKTEVKFEEERLIYNYIRVTVKHALGKFLVSPTLDFDSDVNFGIDYKATREERANISGRKDYRQDVSSLESENLKSWKTIYENLDQNSIQNNKNLEEQPLTLESDIGGSSDQSTHIPSNMVKDPYQIHNTYIINHIKSGYLLIDQQNAHERILYEENLAALEGRPRSIQKELFPLSVELDSSKSLLMVELMDSINSLGFEISHFGDRTYLIHGVPTDLPKGMNPISMINDLIDQYIGNMELQLGINENLSRAYAKAASIKRGSSLSVQEMKKIIDQLFACSSPFISPSGHKCVVTYDMEELKKKFV